MDPLNDIALPEGLAFVWDDRGLALAHGGMVLRGDFARLLPRLRQDRLAHELLVRAARVRGVEAPTAVDCTAGLGEDALLLAAAGFSVTLIERDPAIAALLADAIARAGEDPRLAEIAGRMALVVGDAVDVLPELGFAPDVVFLDPMFPAKRKDAATNKKLQIFQMLEEPCADEEELLAAALAAHPRKVVVKRPLKGPALAGAKPSSSLSGKVVRYDIIAP
ncbi:MAG: class I SAM-dependent methyltransferase [Coriobacteriaceae bacterium]|nr:class I SAM-dependent methyltransferase [Coriobacteriaceae bacterium]